MLIMSSSYLSIDFLEQVKATVQDPISTNPLNLTYVWQETETLANIVKNYPLNLIPKGRAFGSWGGQYTAQLLKLEMDKPYIDLDDTKLEKIEPIDNTYYNKILNVTDFQLQVYNSETYPFSTYVPKTESFAFPAGHFLIANNYQFDNVTVKKINIKEKKILDIIKDLYDFEYTIFYSNCIINKNLNFAGEVVYLNDTASIPDPEDQCGIIYILNETTDINGTLENITSSKGCVIIDNASLGGGAINKTIFSVANVSYSTGPQLRNLLLSHNDSIGIIEDGVLTIMYNFTCKLLSGYALIDQMPDHIGIREWLEERYGPDENNWPPSTQSRFSAYFKRVVTVIDLLGFLPRFKAMILYDTYDQHLMGDTGYKWNPKILPPHLQPLTIRVPIFTVNNSVGDSIEDDIENVRLTGRVIRSVDDVTAHNVMGNLTIPYNPQDKIAVISNRYDGWWGQTPGDSGFGAGIVLGIARLMAELKEEYNIFPKYDTTFLFTTGEEYGLRGAGYYSDLHNNYDDRVAFWLVLDQLAFNQHHVITEASISNTDKTAIIQAIVDDSNFESRTDFPIETNPECLAGTEQKVYAETFQDADVVCLADDKFYEWDHYHRTGQNFNDGDAMDNLDQNKGNVTAEIAWNITKYFLYNPDCWFENITYQTWDSSTDNNTLIDSVNVTFSVNSCLPQDRIWVKATLISQDHPILCRYKEQRYYTITPSGIQDAIAITLPAQAPKGNYILQVFLYNSTGEIDRSLISLRDYQDFGQYANEIYQTDNFSLYPSNDQPEPPHRPWGPTQMLTGEKNTYKSHTTDPKGDHLYYQWQYEYQFFGKRNWTTAWRKGGPYASGVNCTKDITWYTPGIYNVRVRAKDNLRNPNVITNWSLPLQVTVSKSTGGFNAWNSLLISEFISEFSSKRVAKNQQTKCYGFATGVNDGNEGSLNWTWDFGDDTVAYSENVNHAYSDEGNYTVNLTLMNSLNETYNFTTTISVDVLRAGFNPSGDEQPGKTIYFNDASIGSSSLVNWTWEFGDGNRSYDRNTSHMYTETEEYNITLTVRDTLNNTDIYAKPVFIESFAPEFVSVVDDPDLVGFGSNVMISADFFDNQSGVESVMVNITYPDNTTGNFTMGQNVSSEHDFVYIFNDTWQNGVYNYSIWVVDHANNTNYTSGFNFTVSADATISICTVKNIFTNNESINFTDPPAQPVNTPDAWQLTNRGETWNQYYNQQEKNYRVTCSDTPINYKDTGNNYQPINTTIQPLTKTINNSLYTRGVTRGIYSLYLKQTMNATDTTPMVIIEKDRYRMTQTPPDTLTVSYNQTQKLSTICTQNTSRITQDGDTVLYEHAYRRYNTTDDYAQVSYQYYPTMMKSNLILTDQNAVQDRYTLLQRVLRTSNLWVQYQTQMTALDTIGNISLGVMKNDTIYRLCGKNTTVNLWTAERIWFTDQNNTPVFAIPPLYAVDNAGNATLLMKHLYCGSNTDMMTLTIYVSLPWLSDGNRLYPVYIDPSVEINAGSGDGWALQYGSSNWDTVHDGSGNSYSSSSTYDYGISAACSMTGLYSIKRSFFRFNTSSIPDDASIVNASVFLYGKFYNSQPEPVPTPQASGVVFQKWTGGGTISSGDYNDFSGGIYGSLNTWTTSAYNELVWENSLSDIDIDGSTDICVREWAHDYNDSAPEEESSYSNYLTYAEALYMKPYINVTYVSPTSPEVTLIIPEDYAVNISLNPCVKVSVTQQEGKDVTVQWYQNATTGSWTLFASNVTDGNETVMQNCPWINENGKWYHLKIDAKVGSWPSVQEYYQFYPGVQSKIENTGDTDINGFLVVWLEEYNVTSGNWSYLDELYRDDMMRRVNSSCSFGIDTVCNGLVNGSMLAGETGGVFRVYAGFYSLHDEVLVCSDDTELVAWWEFEIE